MSFEIRQAKELLDIKEALEFSSRGEFIYAIHSSSNHEYLPIGFIGEKGKTSLVDMVGNAVGGVVNVTGKVITGITNALTLADTPESQEYDFKNVLYINSHLTKKEKIIIKPDTTMVVVHNKEK